MTMQAIRLRSAAVGELPILDASNRSTRAISLDPLILGPGPRSRPSSRSLFWLLGVRVAGPSSGGRRRGRGQGRLPRGGDQQRGAPR
jgi:hypothetical protein